MALLLSEVMRHQPLIPVVEARDLARVLLLVLSSPLVQSREARDRLLAAARPRSATSCTASCTSIATAVNRASTEGEQGQQHPRDADEGDDSEEAVAVLFGLPQTPWPCDRGWLDGLFYLVQCCSAHPVSRALSLQFHGVTCFSIAGCCFLFLF